MLRRVRTLRERRIATTTTLTLALVLAATCAGIMSCARQARVEPQSSASQRAAAAAAASPDAAAPATPVAAVAAATAPNANAAGNLLVSEAEYQGWRYYHVYCARCHNQDALGSLDAPDLRESLGESGGVSADSFMVIVRKGADNKEMPPFHEVLDDAQIRTVYAYVKARSDGRLAAGRPRRRTAATTP